MKEKNNINIKLKKRAIQLMKSKYYEFYVSVLKKKIKIHNNSLKSVHVLTLTRKHDC